MTQNKPTAKVPQNYLLFRYIQLYQCVFLVKNIHTKHEYLTNRCVPDVRPLKIFWNGKDATRFLTFRNNLTTTSYYFLTQKAAKKFSVNDIRSFFRVYTKLDFYGNKAPPNTKTSMEIESSKKAKVHYPTEKSVAAISMKAPELPTQVPVTSAPEYSEVAKKLISKPKALPNYQSVAPPSFTSRVFEDHIVFNALVKLMLLKVAVFRFSESRFQLFMTLKRKGLTETALSDFKEYLSRECPIMVTPSGLHSLVTDAALQYGWVPNSSLRVREDSLRYQFSKNDYTGLGLEFSSLPDVVFTDISI